VSFVSVDFDFYSDIRFFFGGFTAAKIRRRIRLADFFSADIRQKKNLAANSDIRRRLMGV